MIIGLAGNKQVGKDTIGKYLVDAYGYKRYGFADNVKLALAALFNVPVSQLEQYKNDPTCKVVIGWENRTLLRNAPIDAKADAMWFPMVSMTLREAMQRMGTEVGRDLWGKDFWIDLDFPKQIGEWIVTNLITNVVITDVRFENEVQRIKEMGGQIWLVRKEITEQSQDTHESE